MSGKAIKCSSLPSTESCWVSPFTYQTSSPTQQWTPGQAICPRACWFIACELLQGSPISPRFLLECLQEGAGNQGKRQITKKKKIRWCSLLRRNEHHLLPHRDFPVHKLFGATCGVLVWAARTYQAHTWGQAALGKGHPNTWLASAPNRSCWMNGSKVRSSDVVG